MKLLVGLGNPGDAYSKTRHNVGFMVIECLAEKINVAFDQKKFNASYVKTKILDEDVILMKPLTYMNLSGEAVQQLCNFYRIDAKDIVVVYDDMDLPLGKLRIREKGTGGRHKGMRNIALMMGTEEIPRIRVGIGKNEHFIQSDYVLGRFSKEEKEALIPAISTAAEALKDFPSMKISDLMKKYNTVNNE